MGGAGGLQLRLWRGWSAADELPLPSHRPPQTGTLGAGGECIRLYPGRQLEPGALIWGNLAPVALGPRPSPDPVRLGPEPSPDMAKAKSLTLLSGQPDITAAHL